MKLYSISQVAERFGVTKKTIYNWIGNPGLPCFKTENGKTYFSEENIEEIRQMRIYKYYLQ